MSASPDFPRRADWQDLLDQHLRAAEGQPFTWSTANCTTFASRWVEQATGRPLVVPSTTTARATLRTIAALGGLAADATRQLGEPVPGLMAQCGDVVLLSLPRSRGRTAKAFGVCIGSQVAAQGHAGVILVPITEAEAAWRI